VTEVESSQEDDKAPTMEQVGGSPEIPESLAVPSGGVRCEGEYSQGGNAPHTRVGINCPRLRQDFG
jgi:hypothetical protein